MRINTLFLRIRTALSLPAIVSTSTLLAADVVLFQLGYTWTPVHYESFLPILLFHSNNWRPSVPINALFILGFLIFYLSCFVFHLNGSLVLSTSAGKILIVIFGVIFLIQLYKSFSSLKTQGIFLVVILSIGFFDKIVYSDTLSSSVFAHFFRITDYDNVRSATPNLVNEKLKEKVSRGRRGGVFIIMESLGVPKNRNELNHLEREFKEFYFFTMAYYGGSTVDAEKSYLCGVTSPSQFRECIPNNVPSIAVHGNTLSYFDRYTRYKQMGFYHAYGRAELRSLERCTYGYRAVCDSALLSFVLSHSRATKCKELTYLLTIDSHFPYLKYPDHVSGLYGDLKIFLEKFRVLKRDFPNCEIIIAGDHPPPLAGDFENDQVLVVISK